jgi:hypothetical protein
VLDALPIPDILKIKSSMVGAVQNMAKALLG